ncbi:DNA adenine methylase [Nocardioides sp. SYSU DS0663]|uniref:DNA adenine methylase n=1 Tax=Nocardioides sp. SYSU DS0663 TaxID=3416445 RepID=UPI003F4B6E36
MSFVPGLHSSPLRYPGGKGKLANYVKLLLLENDLVGCDYVEPYAGGASVALSLLFEDYADTVHINDLNPGVHAFWSSVLNSTADLCALIVGTEVTMDEWFRQREVAENPRATPLELGYATFFLNRTNRSGIISGGVIGGKDQSGDWKLDARFNKSDLVSRIQKIGRHRSRIEVTQQDAADFLLSWAKPDSAGTKAFLYLDPPYYVKGKGLYDNFYGPDDHARIAAAIGQVEHPWIVSYDAAPEIVSLYDGFEQIRYSLSYSANRRGRGSEVMFFSPGLRVPDVVPSTVTSAAVQQVKHQPALI